MKKLAGLSSQLHSMRPAAPLSPRGNWWYVGLVLIAACGLVSSAQAVPITLSGTSYSQNFNGIGTALPDGVGIFTGATASGNGTAATYVNVAGPTTSWATTTGSFRNAASATGQTGSETAGAQALLTNRALAVRQTGSFGDPGAAFVISIANTLGFKDINFGIDLQMLSVQSYSTIWSIGYRLGGAGSYTTLSTYTDPGTFGSTNYSVLLPGSVFNQAALLELRIAALSAATGSGSRDTFGIDNLALNYTAIPEPSMWALCGLGVVGFVGASYLRRKGARRLA